MCFTLVGLSVPKAKKACLPRCDLTNFFVQLHFDFITYRQSLTTIARQKVTCLYIMGNCLSAEQNIPDCIRPLGFSAKLCTSSGVKLLRWSLDWSRMTIGFCCKTLHQFWWETVMVIAWSWLTTYDYWLLLGNFAPDLVWNFYGDRLTDHVRLLQGHPTRI